MNKAKLEVEYVACSFCGTSGSRAFASSEGWNIVQCTNCGFRYTNPRPTLQALPGFYREEYFADERHKSKFYHQDGSIRLESGESYFNRILDIEDRVKERGILLELGCARGFFLQTMRDRGWEVEGVEISQDAVAIAKEHLKLNVSQGVLEDFSCDRLFDVVCMYQTLEHVLDPLYVLERSFHLLRNGGLFVAEVPHVASFDMLGNDERKRLSFDLPRHMNHFTPEVLKRALHKVGFGQVEIEYYPPAFLLKFLENRARREGQTRIVPTASMVRQGDWSASIPRSSASPVFQAPPLAKKSNSNGNRITKMISRVLPGWRFTVVARK